jgi:hypothetical protein
MDWACVFEQSVLYCPLMRKSLVIAVLLLTGLAAIVLVALAASIDQARATLPPALVKTLASGSLAASVHVNGADARKVTLDDGTNVFLVPGEDGDACIGLDDGSAACGPATEVAAGRVFLIMVAGAAGSQRSAVPAEGSAQVDVYGYQPADGAARAVVLGAAGQPLGSGEVVEGLYRVKVKTDAQFRRISAVRFESAVDATTAPPPVPLD